MSKKDLLASLREGKRLSMREELLLIWQLSIPAVLAQISHIILEYADASMVGRLGPAPSAAIGLVSSTTWLFGGLCTAAATGFTVQVAHRIGAGELVQARSIVRHGLAVSLGFALFLSLVAATLSPFLPHWLGGSSQICPDASVYFLIYALGIPFMELNYTAGGMLQCSGNMKTPGMLNILMCFLNILFNALLIFPSGTIRLPCTGLSLPGADLGVKGAALGTVCSEIVCALLMLYFLLAHSEMLHLRQREARPVSARELKQAARIAIPQGFESTVMGSAYVAFTAIVAPLGTIAIAANSFSITAEGLCYMPGYGLSLAATTLIGQCFGARRYDLTRRMSWLLTFVTMAVMGCSGALMYCFAPQMIGLLSPDPAIQALGTVILRIEAVAEPFYGASIVISGIFRGMGNTLTSSILTLVSMWAIRIPLAAVLRPGLGLRGVWMAMRLELILRGLFFLLRLKSGKR